MIRRSTTFGLTAALCLIGAIAQAQATSVPTEPAGAVAQPGALSPLAAPATIDNVRVSETGGRLMVSVSTSNSIKHREFMLQNPSRLVLDFLEAENKVAGHDLELDTGAVKKIRVAQFRRAPVKVVRLVFDLGTAYRRHEIIKEERSLHVVFPAGQEAFGDATVRDVLASSYPVGAAAWVVPDHWKVTEQYADSLKFASLPAQSPLPVQEGVVPGGGIFTVPQMVEIEKAVPAQRPGPYSLSTAPQPAQPMVPRSVTLTVGRGELVQFADEASGVSVSDPAIADAVVVSAHEVVLNAKTPGNTTIMIWHGENVSPYEVNVEPDVSALQKQLRAAFPFEQIELSSSKDAILLTGSVSDAEVVKQAAAIAAPHAKSVVNLLKSPPADSRQVMLQVKFATVDRTTLSQFGVNLFSVNQKLLGTSTTQQFQFPRIGQLQFSPGPDGQPVLGNQSVSVSDLLNLFAFRPDLNIGAIVRLLQSKNVLEILAEPNLITLSGHEASFLAGGKFPFPVISSTGSGAQAAPVATIQFRDFGVRLTFTPTVETNGLIHLKVRPEVSSLDFANALTIQGFLIPAISSREVETEVDLREGETFAIAGLIDNRVTQVVSKMPGIGDLPILGHLFRTRDIKKSQSELLVLITPSFVKPFVAGTEPPLPQFPETFLDPARPQRQSLEPAFVGPRGHEPSGKTP